MIKFNDGVSFNTKGELRIEHLSDGYYVVGEGMVFAVETYEEGAQYIAEQKAKYTASTVSDR